MLRRRTSWAAIVAILITSIGVGLSPVPIGTSAGAADDRDGRRDETWGAPDAPSAPAPNATPQRYLDEVFSQVEVTPNLLYHRTTDYLGQPIDLRLDIYEPAGDTALDRPLVVFMHGGWFAFGTKDGMGPIAETYARRGFVVAAIDYRINPENGWDDFDTIAEAMADPVFLDSVLDADSDARTAVAWIRARAAALRVHPDAIVAAGHSAGAVLSLMIPYIPFSLPTPGSFFWNSRVAAALPWSGVIPSGYIQAGEPPAHVSHGTADTTIPYSYGQAVCTRMAAVGNTCQLHTLPGVGHSLGSHRQAIVASEAPFLLTEVLAPVGIGTDVSPTLTATFSDVPPTQPLFREIECAAELGVAGGYPDGTYRPTLPVDRQAMAAFLHRAAGRPSFTPSTPTFDDVPADHPFFHEIEWAAAAGVAEGYPDGTYRPTAIVTRQEAAAFFFGLFGEPGYTSPGQATFPDVALDHPFFRDVEWAAGQGVVTGRADGTFGPTDRLLRQAAAAFACRASLLGL